MEQYQNKSQKTTTELFESEGVNNQSESADLECLSLDLKMRDDVNY